MNFLLKIEYKSKLVGNVPLTYIIQIGKGENAK